MVLKWFKVVDEGGERTLFMGEYQHNVDSKGRIILPAKFRELLGEMFIATKGLDRCLFIYPKEEWAILEDKLKKLPMAKQDARAFVRFFFSGAAELEFDKQGRVLLPIICVNMPGWKKILLLSVFPAELKFGTGRPGLITTIMWVRL